MNHIQAVLEIYTEFSNLKIKSDIKAIEKDLGMESFDDWSAAGCDSYGMKVVKEGKVSIYLEIIGRVHCPRNKAKYHPKLTLKKRR